MFLSFIPIALYGLWIYASSQKDDHMESVELYHSFFAPFLQSRYGATYVGILGAMVAFVFLLMGFTKSKSITIKVITTPFMIVTGLLFLLYLFSLM